MVEAAKTMHSDLLTSFAKLPSISMAIDAGTIERRHFLDIMLLAPYTTLSPFLYDSVEQARLTAQDYGNIVADAIRTLKEVNNVDVRSIVGDNLPAQVSALAHWSPNSRLRGQGPFLNRVKYSPCLCHFVQLVVGDIISGLPLVTGFELILHEMIKIANASDVQKICKCRCPQIVKTRWLSRCEALDWLFHREWSLKVLYRRLPEPRASEIALAFSGEHFNALEALHQLMFPLNEAVKFFERDDVTLAYVYPALKHLKAYLINEKASTEDRNYAEHIDSVMTIVTRRRRKHLDWKLIKAAFYLTSFGCRRLADPQGLIPGDHQLHLEYSSPRRTEAPVGLELFAAAPSAPPAGDPDDPCEEEEFAYEGDLIAESVEPPRDAIQEKPPILTFLWRYLVEMTTEDGHLAMEPPEGAAWPSLQNRIDEIISEFFCNEDWLARCRRTPATIGKQAELWNYLARSRFDHAYDDIVTKVISIISIPASEACCERSLSRQKRLMGHFRARSNPELIRARILLDQYDAFGAFQE
jgi:hypothetical protein